MNGKRVIGLDVVRIILACSICAFHTTVHLGCDYGLAHSFIRNGAVLMTSFFLLSGFSISISNMDVNEKTLKAFYLKRAISIVPMYYVCAIGSDLMNILYSVLYVGGEHIDSKSKTQ